MRCNLIRLATIAVVLGIAAGSAWAFPPSNPYILDPLGTDPQAIDRTLDFQGNQASSYIVTPKPDGTGFTMDITWSTGDLLLGNATNTKVVPVWRFSNAGPPSGDGDGGDLDLFDGVKWCVTLMPNSEPLTIKPFTQTYGTFTFYEGTQPGTGGAGTFQPAASGLMEMVSIDWNMVNNGGTIPRRQPRRSRRHFRDRLPNLWTRSASGDWRTRRDSSFAADDHALDSRTDLAGSGRLGRLGLDWLGPSTQVVAVIW